MTAERVQGRTGLVVAVLAAGVMLVCGPALGQSYWAQRARAVAAARLGGQAAANTDETPAARAPLSPLQSPERKRRVKGDETPAAHPPLSPTLARGGEKASETPAPPRSVFELPAFWLAAGPATVPAGETPAPPIAGETGPGPAGLTTRESVMQAPATQESVTGIRRGPLPGFFETVGRDLLESPKVLWEDTKATYGNPWNLAFLLGAGGTAIALRPEADDDIEDFYDKHHTFPKGERDTFDVIGNPGTAFAVAGLMYVAGQTMQESKTYEVGKRAFSALIITDLSTLLVKVSAGTEAPNGRRFAFPSGHVSSTMALATVLNDAYGPLVGGPMYAVTVFSGIQRLDSREHSFSDVIFGAALGWVVAESVMKEHRPEIFGGEIVPYCDPSRACAGVAWIKPLGK